MDPLSKRVFWNIILKMYRDNNKCGILTTHSMEEAEALCQRIGILIKGELKCVGSSQHLKDKYMNSYTLEVRINRLNDTQFKQFIEEKFFGKAELVEYFSDRYIYNLSKESMKSLSYSFSQLEQAKLDNIIVEYDFSQSTLEQVFIKFAKLQEQED
jgi:ATP-binding cassette, subfamily A (ABC1), member 5